MKKILCDICKKAILDETDEYAMTYPKPHNWDEEEYHSRPIGSYIANISRIVQDPYSRQRARTSIRVDICRDCQTSLDDAVNEWIRQQDFDEDEED